MAEVEFEEQDFLNIPMRSDEDLFNNLFGYAKKNSDFPALQANAADNADKSLPASSNTVVA